MIKENFAVDIEHYRRVVAISVNASSGFGDRAQDAARIWG